MAYQIKVFASHDWFVRDNGDGTITVLDRNVCVRTNAEHKRFIQFGDFDDVMAWAGY